ncbi:MULTISPECIES: PTS transporter subunit EIIC [unclassified Pseudocitrobacter]|uniref:PTS transporter subunit EIIC n=1 Tax=unclassified Pseudocitrobacter TaxID=2638778 RepID=UPI0023E3A3C3|nr:MULTISPECIES: PTS transporter subunit EIIC [unclassified Pseudocitrobacter]MDF3828258.1 PTS transporter subunit EIIC [Pseudocitrobacter sp. 2023EL-00150]MEC5374413.1 PTS transporter subunit EIIC [Pseudocitrobacter sp. MW920760]
MSTTTLLTRITDVSQKMASEVHLRSLRDSFIITVPFLVLAGLFIMVNYVFLDPNGMMGKWFSSEALLAARSIGDRILNGTMSILALMLVVLIAWSIASKRKFAAPMIPAMVSLAAFLVLMPQQVLLTPVNSTTAVAVSGVISLALTNAGGIFMAILTAIVATDLFLWVAKTRWLQIRMGDEVPPMVTQSFQSMFSIILVVLAFALLAAGVKAGTGKEVHEIIQALIQAPLVHLTTNLPGFLVLTTLTNFLFSLGIHPSGIINPILEPPLLVAMQENMAAFAHGDIPPHIIVLPFRDLYGHMGGTGTTLALLLAIFLRSKVSSHQKLGRTVLAPGLFNINEPVIFGFPVLYNPLIMIPFIIYPQINFVIAYFATQLGMVSKIVAFVPWSVPPLLSGWLGSGGDFRNVILQVALLALGVVIYLPFLMAYEKTIVEAKVKTLVDSLSTEQPTPAEDTRELSVLSNKTIILTCNEGMSTSIMANKMRKYAEACGYALNVYAINIGRIEEEYQKADLILLGPQVVYMRESIMKNIDNACPVVAINAEYFSKLDGKSAIEDAVVILNNRTQH